MMKVVKKYKDWKGVLLDPVLLEVGFTRPKTQFWMLIDICLVWQEIKPKGIN